MLRWFALSGLALWMACVGIAEGPPRDGLEPSSGGSGGAGATGGRTETPRNDEPRAGASGAAGSTGGTGGSGGAPEPPPPNFSCAGKAGSVRSLKLTGCSSFSTVAAFESGFLSPTCGRNSACHQKSQPVLLGDDLFVGLVGVLHPTASVAICPRSPFVDLNVPQDSWLVRKTQDRAVCPSDPGRTSTGARMPTNEPALSSAQKACLEAYVRAIAEGCKP